MDALARVEQLRHLSDRDWSDAWEARQALRSASAVVRGYCSWWIAPVMASTAVLSGDGSRVLGLPCMHVVDVVSVAIDGVAVPAAPQGYRWSSNGVLMRPPGLVWPDELSNVSVSYVGGYDTTPEDVVAVVCALADELALPTGIAAQSYGDQSVTYARASDDALELTKGQMRILDRGFVVPPRA